MRVLVCHNYYQQPGGEDRVFADEISLLRSGGHEVFTLEVHNDTIRERGSIRLAQETIWNGRVASQIEQLVRKESLQIAHFHNTFPLISPAAYYGARRGGAAVVQTLHNYRLVCPAATLCRDGKMCTRCLGKRFAWPAVWHGCYRGSRPASTVLSSMLALHHHWGTWSRAVDRYVALTNGAKDLLITAGLPGDRISVKPNFVLADPRPGAGNGGYAVFVGRLASEKGIETLLEAWKTVPGPTRLVILGDGPLREQVRDAANSDPRIEWMQWRDSAYVLEVVGRADCMIVPSIWLEGFPRSLVESMAKGTPAVVSRIGAMAELIEDGVTGVHFRVGDPQDLAVAVNRIMSDRTRAMAMRSNARWEFERKYTAESNLQMLCRIYEDAAGTGLVDQPAECASAALR